MEIKETRKLLPDWLVSVWRINHDGYYENPIGVISRYESLCVAGQNEQIHYSEIEGKDLVINEVMADDDGFFAKEKWRFVYNEKYNEFEEIPDFVFTNNTLILNPSGAKNAIYKFMASIITKQKWYMDLVNNRTNITIENCVSFLRLFYYKAHKSFPLLIQNEHFNEMGAIIDGRENPLVIARLNKKVLDFSDKASIDLENATKLLQYHNYSELMKFVKVTKSLELFSSTLMITIATMGNINFTRFADYLVKQVIVLNNVSWGNGGSSNLIRFVKSYSDYLRFIAEDEEPDLYPDDLRLAHDAAMDRYEFKKEMSSYNIHDFKKSVDVYKNLEWEKENLKVVIPEEPYDLIRESKELHHCVKTYINQVETGKTWILLVRKDGKPYMTVEIKDGKLIQAKKKCNHLPNEDDEIFLKQWSKEKLFEIVAY